MTPEVLAFVAGLRLSGPCLDIGAYDVNGNPRHLFAEYTGLDMRPGPNVDVVASANALPFLPASFAVVLCLEMFEHDADPFGTAREIARVLRPGGKAAVSVPSIGFPRHDYPHDYWRFTADGLAVLLQCVGAVATYEDADHAYAVAVRSSAPWLTPGGIVAAQPGDPAR